MANEQPAAKAADKTNTPDRTERSGNTDAASGRSEANRSRRRPQRSRQGANAPEGGARNSAGNAAGGGQRNPSGNRSGNNAGRNGGNPPRGRAFSNWTWREYLLQLSVVIAGIMVTFIGSDLIGRWSRQRQVKIVMQLVAEELKTNRTELEGICRKLRYDRRGMLMFQDYGMEVDKIPTDSLERYMFIIGAVQGFMQQTDALEVLKTSGVIPAIGDKHLLMTVLGCYRELDGFNTNVEFYNQRKIDGLNHLFANTPVFRFSGDDPREAWTVMMNDPMCSAFIGTAAYNFGEDDFFDKMLASVDDTIAAIHDKYGFE